MKHESPAIQLKEKQVHELVEKMKHMNTLMIVSIHGLPSKQFQEIKKSIRNDAFVKIARKNILVRALDNFGKESVLPLKQYIDSDIAFVLSQKDGYELAGILAQKKTRVFAKAGQIAESDIEIKEGPTELVPGPAISELGVLGLQISVENGKIAIKTARVVVKQGDVIKENVASILQKLNIQPFNVGLAPVVIYDIKKEKMYAHIVVDSEGYAEALRTAAAKSLGLAQKINFYCKETIGYLFTKAHRQATKLETINKSISAKEEREQ